MIRLLKRMLKALWHKTAFVRRPIMTRIDHRLTFVIHQVIETRVPQVIVPTIQQVLEDRIAQLETNLRNLVPQRPPIHDCPVYEVNLVLNSVVREIARLQMEVETLQQMVEESANRWSGLSIVGGPDDHERFSDRGGEHAQVG
jgi:hypothetical protein